MDIQPDALDPFRTTAKSVPSVETIETVPMLRGRIVKVKAITAKDVTPAPRTGWSLRGDRGLTYSEKLPRGSKIIAGEWWSADYSGPPLVSFTPDIADGLELKIGNDVVVNVLGRDITAKISSLRAVDWESLGINFVMVFSPGALRAAPHTHLATIVMAQKNEATLVGQSH